MNSNSTGNNLPSVNMISEGTHLKGNLSTKNDIRIAGSLEGEAKAEGKLIISSTGKVNGDVHAVDADIAGRLEGEIRVSNKLVLRQSAVIDGDIHTKSLLVEEGAQINGACRMGESIAQGPSNKEKEQERNEESIASSESTNASLKSAEPQKVE
ncbi:MAG: polymer-forming cytoskeletal protein [Balneolaceae bacterium]|nr:polymer-forming cytoskeletal protein [Balneolaceae bacterium]